MPVSKHEAAEQIIRKEPIADCYEIGGELGRCATSPSSGVRLDHCYGIESERYVYFVVNSSCEQLMFL